METLASAWSAIRSAITRAKVTASAMGTIRPVLQLQGYNGEVYNGVPLLLPYSMSAVPPVGADVVLARIAGVGNHKVAFGGNDPSGPITNLVAGEVGFRACGSQIVLRATGNIEITAAAELTITAASQVSVTSPVLRTSGSVVVGTGATGSFTTPTGQTVTVQDGIITNIY